MKKILLLLIIGASFSISASAQLCGFDYKMEELKRQNPEYAQQFKETEQYIRNYVAKKPEIARRPMSTLTVPVVVHVMHTGGAIGTAYNPTDAQIMGAIDYLNEVFSGTYTGMEPPVEGGGVVNLDLKFVLAKRTSACGYTNGIVRVDASAVPGYSEHGVNRSSTNGISDLAMKNISRWNAADYYNIWLVNKIDGKDGITGPGQFVAGYAYFAGAPATLDGTVILTSQMKTGRKTLPHELGHAFNLHHTFNGSNLNTTCPTNVDCASDGDGVCDTDPVSNNVNSEGVNNFTPRTGLNSCTSLNYNKNTEHNYMAYTNTATLFTNGQKARVQAAMSLPSRASLFNSPGATPCGVAINFNVATDAQPENNTGTTIDCRTFTDYFYQLNIGEAPDASAIATLSFSGTATKGLDYDVTTNGNFTNPSNEVMFAAGSTTSQPFTLRLYDDANVEGDETVMIDFSINTSGNATKGALNPSFTFTIKDNDVAPVHYITTNYQIGNLAYVLNNLFTTGNAKQKGQFLYKVSELVAAGITAGPINSMELYVHSKGSSGSFNDFTIKIGSSTNDYLFDGAIRFGTGFTQVYNTASLSTIARWNTFAFSTPYIWDGTSNLVVEYCYNSVSGTGSDGIGGYSDGGTSSQFNLLYQGGIDCSGEYTGLSGSNEGIKPLVKFGINGPGTEVETTTSGTYAEYLTTGSDDYFYSNTNKLVAKIGNLNGETGCMQVSVESAGTTWQSWVLGQRSAKVFDVSPSLNGSTTSYTISLYFSEAELGGKDPAKLKIAKTSAGSISEANAGNTELVTPVVTMLGTNLVFTASFTGFSKFFLSEEHAPLPVTLLSFTGKLNDQSHADLIWKVTGQHNFAGFDLERSMDGKSFITIQHVAAMPGTAATYEYSYTDKMVSKGLNYYRLKMMDHDGKTSYSDVLKIVNNVSGQFVALMSNPVKEVIILSVNNQSLRPVTAMLYNAMGAKVAAWQLGTQTGTIQLPVEQYKLVPGMYLLQVSDGINVETLKVLKK